MGGPIGTISNSTIQKRLFDPVQIRYNTTAYLFIKAQNFNFYETWASNGAICSTSYFGNSVALDGTSRSSGVRLADQKGNYYSDSIAIGSLGFYCLQHTNDPNFQADLNGADFDLRRSSSARFKVIKQIGPLRLPTDTRKLPIDMTPCRLMDYNYPTFRWKPSYPIPNDNKTFSLSPEMFPKVCLTQQSHLVKDKVNLTLSPYIVMRCDPSRKDQQFLVENKSLLDYPIFNPSNVSQVLGRWVRPESAFQAKGNADKLCVTTVEEQGKGGKNLFDLVARPCVTVGKESLNQTWIAAIPYPLSKEIR